MESAVSARNEYVGGTRGSGIVSTTAEVLGMSVVRGMRGVGEVCEMCMRLAREGAGGEGGKRIGFTIRRSCGNRESVGRVYVFG